VAPSLPRRATPVPGSWFTPRDWRRVYLRPRIAAAVARRFAELYYARVESTVFATRFLGVQTLKYPSDLWVYQEIVAETLPDLIVETGTWQGGSALYLATICDAIGHGRVISIDTDPQGPLPEHPRLTYLTGSSVAPEVVERVRAEVRDAERVMAILDADHNREHVLAELDVYSDLVTPDCYLVVEDTNVNGNPVLPEHGPGPGEAVAEFLARDDRYDPDRERERLLITANPGGYLRRLR
jgi:cephalosporin hydroxylase